MSLAAQFETSGPVSLEERSLALAFVSFTEAAGSLERSYLQLQAEVSRMRKELEQTNSELERERDSRRRSEALAEISTLLAHEIRNPLGSLELFAGLLAQAGLPGEQSAWVHHLQAGLRMLSATVNNVLHLHSEPRPDLIPCDLGEILASACEFLRPLANQCAVELTLHAGIDQIHILADPSRIQQVLLNLAVNAFRMLPSGGALRLSLRLDAGAAIVEISDNGPGIEPELLGTIFEPGFTTRLGSAGLGLAVSKTIMEQHGGTISVFSTPGLGARFVLSFPRFGVNA